MYKEPQSGCVRQHIKMLDTYSEFDLGETDIIALRFAHGDVPKEPLRSIYFDRRPTGGFSPKKNARIIYTVGDTQFSCSIVLDESQCPEAIDQYAKLSSLSIPLNFAKGERDIVYVGGGYHFDLIAKDGKYNMLSWSGSSSIHPLVVELQEVFAKMAQCGHSAEEAFHQKGF